MTPPKQKFQLKGWRLEQSSTRESAIRAAYKSTAQQNDLDQPIVNMFSSQPAAYRSLPTYSGRTFCDALKDSNFHLLGLGPEMVVIPAGSYLRGSSSPASDPLERHEPQMEVSISKPFAVGATPVTVGQYKLYLAYRRKLPDCAVATRVWSVDLQQGPPSEFKLLRMVARRFQQADNFPIHYVNWFDAQGYLEWLSECTDQHYRLPSEAEWEYMARAGTQTSFPWGDEFLTDKASLGTRVVYPGGMTGRKRQGLSPVKFFLPNAWGIYDVVGNASEWCEDVWHDSYLGAPLDGSAWVEGCNPRIRVLRTGWPSVVTRSKDGSGFRTHHRGFRVVREMAQ